MGTIYDIKQQWFLHVAVANLLFFIQICSNMTFLAFDTLYEVQLRGDCCNGPDESDDDNRSNAIKIWDKLSFKA